MAFEYLENIGESIKVLDGSSKSFQKELKDFTELKIALARDYLLEDPNREGTGTLAASIEPEFFIDAGNSIGINILANDYWDFVNSGVNGVLNKFGAPYSFQTLNPSRKMVDAFAGFDGWMASKGITELVYYDTNLDQMVRKELITDEDFRGAAFVFARAVKRNGIEPNDFIDRAFNEEAVNEFEQLILDALENEF